MDCAWDFSGRGLCLDFVNAIIAELEEGVVEDEESTLSETKINMYRWLTSILSKAVVVRVVWTRGVNSAGNEKRRRIAMKWSDIMSSEFSLMLLFSSLWSVWKLWTWSLIVISPVTRRFTSSKKRVAVDMPPESP